VQRGLGQLDALARPSRLYTPSSARRGGTRRASESRAGRAGKRGARLVGHRQLRALVFAAERESDCASRREREVEAWSRLQRCSSLSSLRFSLFARCSSSQKAVSGGESCRSGETSRPREATRSLSSWSPSFPRSSPPLRTTNPFKTYTMSALHVPPVSRFPRGGCLAPPTPPRRRSLTSSYPRTRRLRRRRFHVSERQPVQSRRRQGASPHHLARPHPPRAGDLTLPSASTSQRAGSSALRPVTIHQLLNAEQAFAEAEFYIDGAEVKDVSLSSPLALLVPLQRQSCCFVRALTRSFHRSRSSPASATSARRRPSSTCSSRMARVRLSRSPRTLPCR